jgi:hypothetical protein
VIAHLHAEWYMRATLVRLPGLLEEAQVVVVRLPESS